MNVTIRNLKVFDKAFKRTIRARTSLISKAIAEAMRDYQLMISERSWSAPRMPLGLGLNSVSSEARKTNAQHPAFLE